MLVKQKPPVFKSDKARPARQPGQAQNSDFLLKKNAIALRRERLLATIETAQSPQRSELLEKIYHDFERLA